MPDDNRQLDRWLNATLKQYGNAEPRAGLENRALANLRAQRELRGSGQRWWWAAGTVAAATATLLVALWLKGAPKNLPVTRPESPVAPSGEIAKRAQAPEVRSRRALARSRATTQGAQLLRTPLPKLNQFPAPRALSRNERALVRVLQSPAYGASVINNNEDRPLADLQISSLRTMPLEVTDLELNSTKEERKTP